MTSESEVTTAERIASQIDQYRDVENMHADLPDINTYWKRQYLVPRLQEVCDARNHIDLYAQAMTIGLQNSSSTQLLSIGSGDGQVEIQLAQTLRNRGVGDFTLTGYELSPVQVERAQRNAAEAGVSSFVTFVAQDLNEVTSLGSVAGVMAHQSLHHIVALEHLFALIAEAIDDGGTFTTFDTVGRNGHMRWPEVLEILNPLWNSIELEKRRHQVFDRVDVDFVNHDCSTQGFEGIRAQDILPLLTETFDFRSFLAYGGLIDPFTTRAYGANFSPANPRDVAFIDFVQTLDDTFVTNGAYKPTRITAVMQKRGSVDVTTATFRDWTPEFCVRQVDLTI